MTSGYKVPATVKSSHQYWLSQGVISGRLSQSVCFPRDTRYGLDMGNFSGNCKSIGLAIRTGFSACVIAGVLVAAPARADDDRNVTLDYAIYIGGFETIRFSFKTSLGATDYKMKMALSGLGILDWWFSWTMNAFSEGRLADGTVVPVRAGADSHWNGKRRRTRLSYNGGGAPSAIIKPSADDDDRDVVPPALRAGARDLAGAVLAGLSRLDSSLDGNEGCTVREAVFDGRRRYNLVLDHLGRDFIKRNDYSPFSGSALRCSIKIKRIAGFRRKYTPSRWRTSDTATLWIGRAFANFPPVPVRMELDTILGGLRAYLVRATLNEGGRIRRLAAAH